MSEQTTTGRHLSRQPSEEQTGRPAERAVRPVNTARTPSAARPANANRPANGQRPAAPARPAIREEWVNEPQRDWRSGGSGGPSGPVRPSGSGRGRKRPPLDMFVRCFLLALLFASMAALVGVLVRTKMLTGKYLLIICGLLIVIFAVVAVLMFAFGKNRRPWGGIIASVLLSAVMIAGSVLGAQGTEALRSITSRTYSATRISVYVRRDDPAKSLEEIAGYNFGVMQTMSHEGVDKAIEDINAQLGAAIQTTGFSTPTQLVNALFDGSVGAVIADASYIDGLGELENYTDLVKQMREITNIHVQVAIGPTPDMETAEEDDHVYTILITGIDSRNGLVRSSLSDVNILVTVNTDTRQVLFVSTPRDYRVPFSNTGELDKLTHAGWYGEEVCMGTIGDLYDVDIDYYFRINFEGFVNIIDALGGIEVNSPMTFDSQNVPGYHYNEGLNVLDGQSALAFVRERFAFKDGDAQRGRNQLEVIRAVIKKVMSADILAKYSSLLTAVNGSFETTVPYDLIASQIRRQLDEGGDWNIVSYSVSGEDAHEVSPALGESVYMMIPDEATVQTAKDMIAQVFNDQAPNAEGMPVGT